LVSTLGKNADVVVNIDSKKLKLPWKYYMSHVLKGNYDDLNFLWVTLFEDSTHLFLDGLIAIIYGSIEQEKEN